MPMNENFWDLLRLAEAPSWTERAKAVGKLAAAYDADTLGETERLAAEELFRALAHDSETVVRRLVAEWLKDSQLLPRDIALALATDCPEVAAPILIHSAALEAEDLLRVVREHPGEHRAAIARRFALAAEVVEALCRCGDERAVATLLENQAAEVPEPTLDWLLEARAAWRDVSAAVARRRSPALALAS
jgi:uncharacterized protein (DUF2336 family)